jgi:hypothetical protein
MGRHDATSEICGNAKMERKTSEKYVDKFKQGNNT